MAGKNAPDAGGQVTVDLDGVLVIAHSDKEDAVATRNGSQSCSTNRVSTCGHNG